MVITGTQRHTFLVCGLLLLLFKFFSCHIHLTLMTDHAVKEAPTISSFVKFVVLSFYWWNVWCQICVVWEWEKQKKTTTHKHLQRLCSKDVIWITFQNSSECCNSISCSDFSFLIKNFNSGSKSNMSTGHFKNRWTFLCAIYVVI